MGRMMVPVPATLMCKVQMLGGQYTFVEIQASWTTSSLREHLQRKLKIPVYEQEYIYAGVRLHDTCVLSDLPCETEPTFLELCLCRTLKPACISEYQAKCLWRSFLQRSDDNGLTVEGRYAGQMAFSAGLYRVDRLIKSKTDLPASFTFPELLMYVSSLEESLPPLCLPLLYHEERLIAFYRSTRQVHREEWALDFDELDFDYIDSKYAHEERTEKGRRLPTGSSIIQL
eukprot:TRINITY_DN6350_c0_g3_i1.p1 TRINITY_DN6350_c0_g3~~TRINITY_DN6350_c0_g3_i1.p1  ORF type:complete len:229 (+),score=30.03 TRINITY_DN6350_c0_g3_i1:30-716(+)